MPGFQVDLEEVAAMYKKLMSRYGLRSVLVEQAEDETAITKYLQYNQKNDAVVGSCGRIGADHLYVSQVSYILLEMTLERMTD